MKLNLLPRSLIVTTLIFYSVACKKSVDPPSSSNLVSGIHDSTLLAVNSIVPYPKTPIQQCTDAPNYGDSLVYPQPGTSDFFAYPKNNQGQPGTYLSWPGGLHIDSKTGIIDLTLSETGERYSLAFVKSGTTDTCISQLIVAGAAYMDSVYVLSQSDTTSTPYFNANPNTPSPCQSNQQGQGCQFDYNKFAKKQGVVVDQSSGYIDLQNTLKKAFGKNPVNGTTVNTTIYYQLDDNSNNASQQIQLQLMYYDRKTDIPANIMAMINNRLFNTLNSLLITKGPSARPPLIVIVRSN